MTAEQAYAELRNPSVAVLKAYWRSLPSPYEIDTEDEKAAREHLRRIAAALSNQARQPGGTTSVLLHEKTPRAPDMISLRLTQENRERVKAMIDGAVDGVLVRIGGAE